MARCWSGSAVLTTPSCHLREALRLRPAYPAALKNLANVLAQSGREAEAMDDPAGGDPRRSGDPDAHFLLALGLAEAGDTRGGAARKSTQRSSCGRISRKRWRLRRELGG